MWRPRACAATRPFNRVSCFRGWYRAAVPPALPRADAQTRRGHDLVAPARPGREGAVVANEMEARRGHEDSKAFDQFERLEEHVSGAVAPAVSEAVDETAVRSL